MFGGRKKMLAVGCVGAAFLFAAPASAATIPVTNTNDSGAGSLREAITTANGDPALDDIPIQTTGTVNLLSPLPDLTTAIDVAGPGANQLTVRRSAGGDYRIITIAGSGDVSVTGVSLADGSVTGTPADGGAVWNAGALSLDEVVVRDSTALSPNPQATARGGGIYNGGVLDMTDSTVRNNVAVATSPDSLALSEADGGGIHNGGTLTITGSTVNANTATAAAPNGDACCALAFAHGGGIQNDGTSLIATNTTVSGNATAFTAPAGVSNAGDRGAGIDAGTHANSTSTTLRSVTLAFNSSSLPANLFFTNSASVNVQNTIFAEPRGGGPSCGDAPFGQGHNLDDGTSCGLAGPTDQQNADPLLQPLADNGGPTETHALARTSPAVDRGTAAAAGTDQRGIPRPVDFADIPNGTGDGSDIGAFELILPALTLGPPSADFGSTTVGAIGAPAEITATNTGGADLDLGRLLVVGTHPADFLISQDACSFESLGPAESCTARIRFAPSTVGTRSATLEVPSNADTSPDAVALTGQGIPALTDGNEPPASPTGRRAAALKKCTQKRGKARKRCRKRANKLPV